MTGAGMLHIRSVDPIDQAMITGTDAERAGYESRDELLNDLARWEGQLYRIELGPLMEDPRIALRSVPIADSDIEDVLRRLDRLDASSPGRPWTRQTLALIRDRPEVRAGTLSDALGQDRAGFKQNVRKLKALGLTESLPVGYRISPRGISVLHALDNKDSVDHPDA